MRGELPQRSTLFTYAASFFRFNNWERGILSSAGDGMVREIARTLRIYVLCVAKRFHVDVVRRVSEKCKGTRMIDVGKMCEL